MASSAGRYLGPMSAASTSPAVELEVGDRTVRISNPDRVYFPDTGHTKLDLANYYLSVGDGIVRALRERPCMLHRFPNGVSGEKVHQKRLPKGAPPWVETVRVHFPRYNRNADELCVTELASVIWAVQMSTVEFHPWNSRRADTEQPDEWRIDLDPMAGCDFATVRRVAHVAHEVLDELGAVGWPKTSGGKGLHIYVRIEPRLGLRRRTAGRAGLRSRGGAPGARRRQHHLVAQGPRPDDGVRRLQPERPRPHHRQRLLGARRPGCDGYRRPSAGTRSTTSTPQDFTIATVPARFAELGDLHAGIDDAVFSHRAAARVGRPGTSERAPPTPASRRERRTRRQALGVRPARITPMSRSPSVVVVGSVNRDYLCRVATIPLAGQTLLGGELTVGSGGKGGNQAVASSLLGAPTSMVACIGDDPDGQALVADLRAAGVDVSGVLTVAGVRSGTAFVMVADDGENSIVVAPGANDSLDGDTVRESLTSRLRPGDLVVLQAETPESGVDVAIDAADAVGARVVLNLAPYRDVSADLLSNCDPIVVNEGEARALLSHHATGGTAGSESDAAEMAAELGRRARSAVVTLGEAGAVVAFGEPSSTCPPGPYRSSTRLVRVTPSSVRWRRRCVAARICRQPPASGSLWAPTPWGSRRTGQLPAGGPAAHDPASHPFVHRRALASSSDARRHADDFWAPALAMAVGLLERAAPNAGSACSVPGGGCTALGLPRAWAWGRQLWDRQSDRRAGRHCDPLPVMRQLDGRLGHPLDGVRRLVVADVDANLDSAPPDREGQSRDRGRKPGREPQLSAVVPQTAVAAHHAEPGAGQ